MDIDVLSRLMHDQYLADMKYQAIGSSNAYGLTIMEAKKLDESFESARRHLQYTKRVIEFYGMDYSLVAAKNAGVVMEYNNSRIGSGHAMSGMAPSGQWTRQSMFTGIFG